MNRFMESETGEKIPTQRIRAEVERSAVEKVRAFRSRRTQAQTDEALRQLGEGVRAGANLQERILSAVLAQATLGEVADTLRAEFGAHREFAGF